MSSSGTWRHLGLGRTNVSDECVASIYRAERIRERERTIALLKPFLSRGFFLPWNGDCTLLRNIGSHNICTNLHPRRRHDWRIAVYSPIQVVVPEYFHYSQFTFYWEGYLRTTNVPEKKMQDETIVATKLRRQTSNSVHLGTGNFSGFLLGTNPNTFPCSRRPKICTLVLRALSPHEWETKCEEE
jgi:hypothetical protein